MDLDRRKKSLRWLGAGFFAFVATLSASEHAAESAQISKPNILWIVTEDIGCDMACYGTKGVHTPNLDRLAAEGALYSRAYTAASTCSPSRSSFMTGMYAQQVFSLHQRIWDKKKRKALPEGVDIFTKYLRDAGYAIGLCGHQKKDWQFRDPKTKPYDTGDWDELTQQQPFFCQYQFYDTHRVNKKGPDRKRMPFLPCPEHPVDRAEVELHPYNPDTPVAREELGAYLENVNLLDLKIGKLITDLKAKGLYENTIIVVMGDNGPPVFRGKGFLYERGIRMPLFVRVPKRLKLDIEAGSRNDERVSALDMAPTFIDLAGGQIPDYMEGRIFFGPNKQSAPEHLFATRDRCQLRVDRTRSVCSRKYKYIRNFIPELTYHASSAANVAGGKAGERLFKAGKLSGAQAAYYKTRPQEELYDLESDPFERNNLAQDPSYEATVTKFRAKLDNWIKRTKDNAEPEDLKQLEEDFRRFKERQRTNRKNADRE